MHSEQECSYLKNFVEMQPIPKLSKSSSYPFCHNVYLHLLKLAYIVVRIVYYYYILIDILDAMEELCFGEDFAELTSLRHLFINVTRSGLGCDRDEFAIRVSYNKSEMESVGKPCSSCHSTMEAQLKLCCPVFAGPIEDICVFMPLQLQTNCTIDLNDDNKDFEASKVQGVVTLVPSSDISTCNESKMVFVFNG